MRLIRLAAPAPHRIREILLDDPSLALEEARALAREVPVPGGGVIDLIAAEPAGRLAIVCVHAEAGAAELAQAVLLWDWVAAHLPALRAMGGLPQADVDLTRDPRLVLVAPAATEAGRRLAGRLARPEVEILRASLVKAGETTALLVEPVAPIDPPAAAAGSGGDELGAIPPGAARSLLRRVVEGLREGAALSPITGGVDVWRGGAHAGSLLCARGGLEARLPGGRVEPIVTDEDCRRVAMMLAAPAAATAARPVAAPLTPEEVRELERGPSQGPARRWPAFAPEGSAHAQVPPADPVAEN